MTGTQRAIELITIHGMSQAQASRAVGVSRASVQSACLAEGVVTGVLRDQPPVYTRRGAVVRSFTEQEDSELLRLRTETSMGIRKIAQALGRSPSSIRGRLRTLARREEFRYAG